MNLSRLTYCVASLVAALAATATHAITIDWVTVGDPGNAADVTAYGAVGYEYQIMKYEWTNAQYVEFLNAVDPQGTNPDSIYDNEMANNFRGGITNTGSTDGSRYAAKANMGDKPVHYVSWFDAARVANWLQAGGLTYGTTASGSAAINIGAYTLSGSTSGDAPGKNVGAEYWIPTENEWYKAAYYKGSGTNAGYWAYATQSDLAPTSVGATVVGTGSLGGVSPVISGNSANFNQTASWGGQGGSNVTTVGSNGGPGAYGTFDQSGNVWEWNDLDGTTGSYRGQRSGDCLITASHGSSSFRRTSTLSNEPYYLIGFRLASPVSGPAGVPETDPAGIGSVLALVGGALGMLERRRRRTG